MNRVALILGSVLLLLAAGARGQEAGEGALFDQVSSLRLELERLDDARQEVARQRDRLRVRMEDFATRIKQRKAASPGGGLLPDFTLQDLLRKSQELSESLTLINKELEALDGVRRMRLQKLGQLYGQLVDQTADGIRRARGQRKAELVRVLARLRVERESVRQALAPSGKATEPLQTNGLLASEDPDELKERADAVRDEQDRLRQRLARLDKRMVELQSEVRLEREMRDFQEDQDLFNEDSRLLQVTKTTTQTTSHTTSFADNRNKEGEPVGDGTAPDNADDGDYDEGADPGLWGGAGECPGGMCGTPSDSGGHEPGDITRTATTETSQTLEGNFPVGVDGDEAELRGMSPVQQLRVLGRARLGIVKKIKKLQILHDRIQEKVEGLEAD